MNLTSIIDSSKVRTSKGSGHGEEGRQTERRTALKQLLATLRADDYRFVTATPATHRRVVARADRTRAKNLRDVLGWSLPFTSDVVQPAVLELLQRAGAVEQRDDGLLAATIRVSSVRGALFLHSAYPTLAEDSVFLGPDSYRFADLIVARMGRLPEGAQILDYGAGAGVGGITAARGRPGSVLTLADINPKALFLASINAEFTGVDHRTVEAGRPADLTAEFDLIVTHPPFMMDDGARAYRDGGDLYGGRLSLDWVCDGMRLLRPGGKIILHTGVSIVDGRDVLLDALRERIPSAGWRFDYHELDPDIFGDELDQPAYAEVERIAAVGLVLTRTDGDG
ncbi:methyltransferase [Sphingomonas aliaeris]|uniref:Methyltransferase n=1 Tax=Sphingomonas aliaeris TaxID=2759526 RepID=A0A974S426_9SPHN|nr:methyltransferase [Sphingomonas aliaeris]